MKLTPFIAMLIVAFDCLGRGAGYESQELFSSNAQWLWYPISVGWFYLAYKFIKE